MDESNNQKAVANVLFAKSEFKDAIEAYDKALSTCPNYLDYEVAVLKSNIAACHLKLKDWKDAISMATAALDALDKAQGKDADGMKSKKDKNEQRREDEDDEDVEEEIISQGAEKAENTSAYSQRETDIERIRSKALLRRARARSETGGWSNLQGAEEGMEAPLLAMRQWL